MVILHLTRVLISRAIIVNSNILIKIKQTNIIKLLIIIFNYS